MSIKVAPTTISLHIRRSLIWLQKHNLSLIKIFEEIDHYSLFLGHVSAVCVATFGMLRSFATTPNFVYCSGFDPCSCAEFFIRLYSKYCDVGTTIGSNETLS